MRICHVVFNQFPSIPAAFEIAKCLSADGIEVDLIALALSSSDLLEETIEGISVFRVPVYRCARSLLGIRKLSNFLSIRSQVREYDLIHVYSFRGAAVLKILSGYKKAKWLLDIRSGNILGGLRSRIGNYVTEIESYFFDQTIVLDQHVGKLVLRNRSFIEVPLGVDLLRWSTEKKYQLRAHLGFENSDIVAVYSGSLMTSRRIDVLIRGFASAQNQYQRLKLLIIGDGDQRQVAELLTAELGLKNHIIFIGQIPYQKVSDYISIADIGIGYVPLTREFDPQPPLKTIELLAAGIAVLATATRGNARYIRNGENGLLVDSTPSSIATGLLQLAENKGLRLKLSQTALASISNFDWKIIVGTRLLPIYQNLIDKNKRNYVN